jgi:hypothetical protein
VEGGELFVEESPPFGWSVIGRMEMQDFIPASQIPSARLPSNISQHYYYYHLTTGQPQPTSRSPTWIEIEIGIGIPD